MTNIVSSIVKINQNFQVTIPVSVRKKSNIEKGDLIEVCHTKRGILLKPKLLLDKLPEVELSKKSEKIVQEAFDDIKQGKVSGPYNNIEDFLKDIKK